MWIMSWIIFVHVSQSESHELFWDRMNHDLPWSSVFCEQNREYWLEWASRAALWLLFHMVALAAKSVRDQWWHDSNPNSKRQFFFTLVTLSFTMFRLWTFNGLFYLLDPSTCWIDNQYTSVLSIGFIDCHC